MLLRDHLRHGTSILAYVGGELMEDASNLEPVLG